MGCGLLSFDSVHKSRPVSHQRQPPARIELSDAESRLEPMLPLARTGRRIWFQTPGL